MNIDPRQLQSHDPHAAARGSNSTHPHPPTNADVLLIGCGNSGEACALAVQALLYADRIAPHTIGVNNDTLAPRPLPVRLPDGNMARLALRERLVLGRDHPRDQLRDYPLLTQRYHRLLRGIPVLETYPQAGHGGHGHPVISALDMDLAISELLAFLRRALHRLDAEIPALPHQSAVQHMIAVQQRQHEPARTKQIIICGGGTGSMGNAAHHILPYLVRLLVAELGWSSYDLWGIILGPQAFAGLTPFIQHNYRALLLALDARTRHGWRCQFINDLLLDMRVPPYDRVFLLDDPRLPRSHTTTTEAELTAFLDQAALSLSLLLRGNVWDTVAAHVANPDHRALAPDYADHPRYLHTVQGVLAGVDRAALLRHLAARLELRIAMELTHQFATETAGKESL